VEVQYAPIIERTSSGRVDMRYTNQLEKHEDKRIVVTGFPNYRMPQGLFDGLHIRETSDIWELWRGREARSGLVRQYLDANFERQTSSYHHSQPTIATTITLRASMTTSHPSPVCFDTAAVLFGISFRKTA
jgi:hypothetical protein